MKTKLRNENKTGSLRSKKSVMDGQTDQGSTPLTDRQKYPFTSGSLPQNPI